MAEFGRTVYETPYETWVEDKAMQEGVSVKDLEKKIEVTPFSLMFKAHTQRKKNHGEINKLIEPYDFVTDFAITTSSVQGKGIKYIQ